MGCKIHDRLFLESFLHDEKLPALIEVTFLILEKHLSSAQASNTRIKKIKTSDLEARKRLKGSLTLQGVKPGFHLNECGREGWQFPLKRIDRFDRIDQTGFNFSIETRNR